MFSCYHWSDILARNEKKWESLFWGTGRTELNMDGVKD